MTTGMEPAPFTDLGDALRRERLLDMEGRLARVRRRAILVLALALIASGPWIGFWFLLPLGVAGIAFAVSDHFLRRSRRPERWAAVGWCVAPIAIAVSVALTGAADAAAMCWFALPVVTLGARFEPRGVWLAVGYTAALMLLSTVVIGHETVLDDPSRVISTFAMI